MLSTTENEPHWLLFPVCELEEDFYEIKDLFCPKTTPRSDAQHDGQPASGPSTGIGKVIPGQREGNKGAG